MKIKLLAIALTILLIFVCGCTTNDTLSGDIYTDFSNNSSSGFNQSSSNIKSITNNAITTSNSSITNQSNDTFFSSSSVLPQSSKTNTSSNEVSSSKGASSQSKTTQSNTSIGSSKKAGSSSLEKPLKLSSIKVTNSNKSAFKTVGRCDTGTAKGLALSWGASSIEFSLFCEGIVSLDFSFKDSAYPVYLRFEADGKTTNDRVEISQSCNIDLRPNFERGTHTIKITRLTDAESDPVILNEISTYGELIKTPPTNKALYIEAIGAANFCGQGLLINSLDKNKASSETSNPQFADVTLTYPYIASQSLNADCYLFARKGAGFAATNLLEKQSINEVTQPICSSLGLFPHLYKLINIHSDKEFIPNRKPDIIVIDADLVDSQVQSLKYVYYNGRVGISQPQAVKITADFLNLLKRENPNLKIVWCYGMTSTNQSYLFFIESVIQKTINGSEFIYILNLPKAANPTYPTTAEHDIAANLLHKKIKTILK